jgi:hypothetical protein
MLIPAILASARKHGIADNDMIHAYRHAIRSLDVDDFVMCIGPNRHGNLLEIGYTTDQNAVQIFHAMPARHKFLR